MCCNETRPGATLAGFFLVDRFGVAPGLLGREFLPEAEAETLYQQKPRTGAAGQKKTDHEINQVGKTRRMPGGGVWVLGSRVQLVEVCEIIGALTSCFWRDFLIFDQIHQAQIQRTPEDGARAVQQGADLARRVRIVAIPFCDHGGEVALVDHEFIGGCIAQPVLCRDQSCSNDSAKARGDAGLGSRMVCRESPEFEQGTFQLWALT